MSKPFVIIPEPMAKVSFTKGEIESAQTNSAGILRETPGFTYYLSKSVNCMTKQKNPHAVEMGKLGGNKRSEAQKKAFAHNRRKGWPKGKPRKVLIDDKELTDFSQPV